MEPLETGQMERSETGRIGYEAAFAWLLVTIGAIVGGVLLGHVTVGLALAVFAALVCGYALGRAYEANLWSDTIDSAKQAGADGIIFEQDESDKGRVVTSIFPALEDPSGLEYHTVALRFRDGEGRTEVIATRNASNERDARRNHNELLAKVG